MEISNFSTEDQKKDLNLLAIIVLHHLTFKLHSCSNKASRRLLYKKISRLSTKATEILEGAKPPIIYFTGAGAPLACLPSPLSLGYM